MKQNHGSIIVYSEPGKGTTFKVFLPVIPQTGEPAPSVKVETSLPGGTETVLLVEDDAGIRSMVTRFLASSGYTVIDAENGEEALSKLHGTTGRVDILVTDVVMPLMGGRELAARLDEMFSGVRVLFMSGYTDNTIVHQGVLEPGIMFIQKPFSMIDFMRKVRETLDGA